MAYHSVPFLVTLKDLEGHSPVAGLFEYNPSNICATFCMVSTDTACHMVHRWQLNFLLKMSRPALSLCHIIYWKAIIKCTHLEFFFDKSFLAIEILRQCIRYRDSVKNSSIFSLILMCWLPLARACGSKTLHQENPQLLNWRCQLTQIDLYNGHKTVVVVVVPSYRSRKF